MLKKAKNFNLFKLSKKYYEKRFFNEDDYEKIHIKKGQEEESKNLREKYEGKLILNFLSITQRKIKRSSRNC